MSTGRWASQTTAEDPAWRAVGARTLVSTKDGKTRRELFLDLGITHSKKAFPAPEATKDQAFLG